MLENWLLLSGSVVCPFVTFVGHGMVVSPGGSCFTLCQRSFKVIWNVLGYLRNASQILEGVYDLGRKLREIVAIILS